MIWRQAVPTFARLLATSRREIVATISRDWPAVAGWRDGLFVEAIPDGRAGPPTGFFIAGADVVAKRRIEQLLANR